MALQQGDVVKITKDRSKKEEKKRYRNDVRKRNEFQLGDVFTVRAINEGGEVAWFEEPNPKTGHSDFGVYVTSLMKTDAIPKTELEPFKKHKPPQQAKVKVGDLNSIVGQDHVKKQLRVAIKKNIPTLIVGETGAGKTSIIRELAKEDNVEYARFSITGETSSDDFVGKWTLQDGNTVWVDGWLADIMQKPVYGVIDEINMAVAELLAVLQPLLDDDRYIVQSARDNRIITPHENFRLFSTMNPVDEYAGTKELNKALKSRFGMTIYMGYVDPTIELEIVRQKSGVSEEIARQIVDLAVKARDAKKNDKIFFTCSTRDLIQWGNLVEDLGMQTAFELTILNKANGDGTILKSMYSEVVNTYKEIESKGFKASIDWFEDYANDLVEREEKLKLHYERKERAFEKQTKKLQKKLKRAKA